ncbi:MAG TPA: class III extradiol ring-cleavage dioxygenase [Lysobacter sp.]|nr:class III extradiol ring-cleavage dioxygenase [Lysobacter sp.]
MRLPSLFISHGAPTFALEPGRAGPQLTALGARLPRPRALLVLSPHWRTRGLTLTGAERPPTIHDFGGFPAPLYALRYPAPGDPALAAEIAADLTRQGLPAGIDPARGLDHGTWVPLLHLYPAADIPVLQLSMPYTLDSVDAHALGAALAAWRARGVLVVGSGSLTHNLSDLRPEPDAVAPYVREFAAWIERAVRHGDASALVDALRRAPHGTRAHPTDEHYLPLPFAAGAAGRWARAEVLDGGFSHGAISMHAFVFEAPPP